MSTRDYLTIDDFDLSGKTVLCRLDLNSPMGPENGILDDKRFRSSLTTVKELEESKLVLMSHQSRPGKSDFTTMEPHAKQLSRLLDRDITYVDDIFGSNAISEIKKLKKGDILMLENVRFFSEESLKRSAQEHASSHMVKRLSPFMDFYMNDAFGVSHRSHLSIMGFTWTLPSLVGRLMDKEITSLSRGEHDSDGPTIFVLGGTKVDDSLKVTEFVLANNNANRVLLTGVVANVFLAAKGVDIGKTNLEFIQSQGYFDQIKIAKKLLKRFNDKIGLPIDVALDKNNERIEEYIDVINKNHNSGLPILDIGLETIVAFSEEIKAAGTVIMNGPAGMFEKDAFALGTVELMQAATRAGFSVIGGGHSAAVVQQLGMDSRLDHVSTGGGACIDFLAGEKLPGIEALKEAAARYRSKK
ncbi:MAG: phosphoglycerate kinase [Methanosarcinales archaeon]|nr:phosphoglycerate kinase [Methanosarcinales archaeon]